MGELVVDGPVDGRVLLGRLVHESPEARAMRFLGLDDRAEPPLAAEWCRGVVLIGQTRSGKTTSLLAPAVVGWDGPVIATSIRADLLRESWQQREDDGWPTLIFNPTNVGGFGTNTWSPLAAVRGEKPWSSARRTAAALIEASGSAEGGVNRAGSNAQFWKATAADYLAPLLLAAAQEGTSMAPVMRWLYDEKAAEDEVPGLLDEYPDALRIARAVWYSDSELKDSTYYTARAALRAYNDDDVMRTCLADADGTTDITPETLLGTWEKGGRVGSTLYVVSPLTEWRYYAPLFAALIDSLMAAAYERAGEVEKLDPPLLLAGDEIANIAPLHELPRWSSTSAGSGIQLITCLQDLGQAKDIWGDNGTRTLLSNHPAKLIMGNTSDPETLKWVSELLGEVETARWTEGRGRGGKSANEHIDRRPLLSAAELRQIPVGAAVLIYGSARGAIVRLRQRTTI